MKALNSSRMSVVVGLILGIMVLYGGASPMVTNADSLIGGWDLLGRCPNPCDGSTTEGCDEGPEWTQEFCQNGFSTIVCITNPTGYYTCTPQGNGPEHDRCDRFQQEDCPGSETTCE